jgi:hypothetical protein
MEDCERHYSKGGATAKEKKISQHHSNTWEELSLEMIEVLLASMPHCMKAVIKANGGSTRW